MNILFKEITFSYTILLDNELFLLKKWFEIKYLLENMCFKFCNLKLTPYF